MSCAIWHLIRPRRIFVRVILTSFLVADDVVQQLQQHGDPWALSQELPPTTGRGHSTPPMDKS
jgi:hypothetical protein